MVGDFTELGLAMKLKQNMKKDEKLIFLGNIPMVVKKRRPIRYIGIIAYFIGLLLFGYYVGINL